MNNDNNIMNLTTFRNKEFGTIRTVVINGEPWFVGRDVAKALGYSNTKDALAKHVEPEDKRGSQIATPGGMQEMTIINESGLYSLILSSKLPTAKKFKHWITSEVLPSLRKTGTYTLNGKSIADEKAKRIDAQYMNACVKKANMYVKLANALETQSKHYKEILLAKAAEVLSGEMILPLPKSDQKTYSATEIGKMFGVSANKVGKTANAYDMKNDTYGEFFRDKSRFSDKEVDSFRYNDTAVEKFRAIFAENN